MTSSSTFESDYQASQPAAEDRSDTSKSSTQRRRQQPGSACEECRRKRIRCDRGTPQCVACANSGVQCVVRSTCAPRGPKKGHLRSLQKQIEELQSRLREQSGDSSTSTQSRAESPSDQPLVSDTENEDGNSDSYPEIHVAPMGACEDLPVEFGDMSYWSPPVENMMMDGLNPNFMFAGLLTDPSLNQAHPHALLPDHQQTQAPSMHHARSGSLSQTHSPASLDLGPYPNSMVCADLDQLYFDRVHAITPILQESRYLSWSRRPDKSKPQMCLQYAMWALAASLSTQFQLERRSLYNEARQLLISLEAETMVTQTSASSTRIEQVQAWILLVIYELTNTDCTYQRGMLSAGRAFRLVQMMRLYEIDREDVQYAGQGHGEVDWIDIESMRRTFWLAYTIDRFTSAIDGLPLAFNERQICTRLPAPDAHFMSGRPMTTCFLSEVMNGLDVERANDNVWAFTKSIVIATICGRALEHKYFRPHADRDPDGTYDYCHRFQSGQSLNALLTQHIKLLSNHLSLASERPDPVLIFVALIAHMAVFILSETLETRTPGSESPFRALGQGAPAGTDGPSAEHKQFSLDIVHKLGTLTATLGQLNHFRTHPLTPIPLLLSARFCLARAGVNETYAALLPHVTGSLERMSNSNGLAKTCLQLLGRECNLGELSQ